MPIFQLNSSYIFPPPEMAEPNGLLAVGGDLSAKRLLAAYSQGIFPWFNEGDPLLWWSPAPRLILLPHEFHLSKRLARTIKKQNFTITTDTAFSSVIKNCALFRGKDREETWITDEMLEAYCHMHQLGYAHSIECRHKGKLVGGLYGIALDRVFFGESMFSKEKDASKIALHYLVTNAAKLNIKLIDCQVRTEHLVRLGAKEISRNKFQEMLQQLIHTKKPQNKWRLLQTGKEGAGHAGAWDEKKKA